MIPNAYLYVITERYPKSGTLRLNENMPQFICQTEDEAKFIIEDLKRLAKASAEPISYEYFRVVKPFIGTPPGG